MARPCMLTSLCAAPPMAASGDVTAPASELHARNYVGHLAIIGLINWTLYYQSLTAFGFILSIHQYCHHTKLSVYSAQTLLTAATTASLTVSSSVNISSVATLVRVSRPPHWRIRQLVTGDRQRRARPGKTLEHFKLNYKCRNVWRNSASVWKGRT